MKENRKELRKFLNMAVNVELPLDIELDIDKYHRYLDSNLEFTRNPVYLFNNYVLKHYIDENDYKVEKNIQELLKGESFYPEVLFESDEHRIFIYKKYNFPTCAEIIEKCDINNNISEQDYELEINNKIITVDIVSMLKEAQHFLKVLDKHQLNDSDINKSEHYLWDYINNKMIRLDYEKFWKNPMGTPLKDRLELRGLNLYLEQIRLNAPKDEIVWYENNLGIKAINDFYS